MTRYYKNDLNNYLVLVLIMFSHIFVFFFNVVLIFVNFI